MRPQRTTLAGARVWRRWRAASRTTTRGPTTQTQRWGGSAALQAALLCGLPSMPARHAPGPRRAQHPVREIAGGRAASEPAGAGAAPGLLSVSVVWPAVLAASRRRARSGPWLPCPRSVPHAAPAGCRSNIWPAAHLPELEGAFKALGQLIMRVGLLLARHCDKYVASRGVTLPTSLHDILRDSPCPKVRPGWAAWRCLPAGAQLLLLLLQRSLGLERRGFSRCLVAASQACPAAPGCCLLGCRMQGRLLHYRPPPSGAGEHAGPNWCGWHTDHGSLTGKRAQHSATLPGCSCALQARPRRAAGERRP